MLGLELDYTALQVLADLLFLLYSPLLPCGSMWSPQVVENKETSTHVIVALQISPRWWSMRRGEAMVSLGKASPHHCSSCRNLKIEKVTWFGPCCGIILASTKTNTDVVLREEWECLATFPAGRSFDSGDRQARWPGCQSCCIGARQGMF